MKVSISESVYQEEVDSGMGFWSWIIHWLGSNKDPICERLFLRWQTPWYPSLHIPNLYKFIPLCVGMTYKFLLTNRTRNKWQDVQDDTYVIKLHDIIPPILLGLLSLADFEDVSYHIVSQNMKRYMWLEADGSLWPTINKDPVPQPGKELNSTKSHICLEVFPFPVEPQMRL